MTIYVVAACMGVKYNNRKLCTLIYHAITCVTCGSASHRLRDFRSSSGCSGSPVMATSVELMLTKTELPSLKTDVTMIADRCSDLTFDC